MGGQHGIAFILLPRKRVSTTALTTNNPGGRMSKPERYAAISAVPRVVSVPARANPRFGGFTSILTLNSPTSGWHQADGTQSIHSAGRTRRWRNRRFSVRHAARRLIRALRADCGLQAHNEQARGRSSGEVPALHTGVFSLRSSSLKFVNRLHGAATKQANRQSNPEEII